jgi:hypothetical protein
MWRVTVIVRKEDTFPESVGRVGYEVDRRVDSGSWDMREITLGESVNSWEVFSEWSILFDSSWKHTFKVHYLCGEEFREEWDGKLDVDQLLLLREVARRLMNEDGCG